MDFKYKDCKKEMDMVNKAFIETMIEGDSNGRGFQYPIPTYSITKDFDWSDTVNNRQICDSGHIDGDNAHASGALAGTEESHGLLAQFPQIQTQ